MRNDVARDILGATCSVLEDKSKVWSVKMPQFIEVEIGTPSMMSPALHMLNEHESDLNEYLDDPTDPVLCVAEQDHEEWNILRGGYECRFGGPGSTVNFWQLSAHSERLTLGVKMHSTAAFLSMPNSNGVILRGKTSRGFNENSI